MAQYTVKTEDRLRWNAIRRSVTTYYDLQMKNKRERDLNAIIHDAENKYVKSRDTGKPMVIESHCAQLVDAILRDHGVPDLDAEGETEDAPKAPDVLWSAPPVPAPETDGTNFFPHTVEMSVDEFTAFQAFKRQKREDGSPVG